MIFVWMWSSQPLSSALPVWLKMADTPRRYGSVAKSDSNEIRVKTDRMLALKRIGDISASAAATVDRCDEPEAPSCQAESSLTFLPSCRVDTESEERSRGESCPKKKVRYR